MKKCPNCGACQECGHVPHMQPWPRPYVQPQRPGTNPYPQTYIAQPYHWQTNYPYWTQVTWGSAAIGGVTNQPGGTSPQATGGTPTSYRA